MNAVRRPDYLRETPMIDRNAVPQEWTSKWRLQVVDLFSGRGGVGLALDEWLEARMFAGFDIEDYSQTYPGRFAQQDLLCDDGRASLEELAEAVEMPTGPSHESMLVDRGRVDRPDALPALRGLTADVVWVSFPCTAYSSLSATHYGSKEAALEANPRITDEFREFLLEIAPHYIIENVRGATRVGDLEANCRVNGLAFGKDYDLERHFETTFDVPDAYVSGDASVTVDTRNDQSIRELANAKGVPAEWGKQAVRSAIPLEYVWWVLGHCPALDIPIPERQQWTFDDVTGTVGQYQMFPDGRCGGHLCSGPCDGEHTVF
ncbi:hypothetical protein [Natronorubrum daqingense]|uniref:DNA (cytosine-5-)-methyltransferase n=1 Tax=Natronorubrum daqingense TaxID=588898 RepID=A0A1N7G0W8_9EURY|nr:hypothetical protein [Natronorubrum daqingense]APX98620.1 hypothetical protein BB347_18170 [Natronorubrum daqingense]SIS06253.1 hypothetical protein SAMN05421809_3650 [Natronorubrum daqingense]